MTFSIVYTLSDRRDMPKQIQKSLKSLSSFVEKQNIFVFYTPPRSRKTERKLEKYATIIKASNTTTPFVFDRVIGLGNYGEKIHLCEMNTSSVIFLDCDTIIKKDVTELLSGSFDFSGRSMGCNRDLDWNLWENYCTKHNKPTRKIFNTGFMIFKNYLHHKIEKEWKKFIESDIPQIHPHSYVKEELALSMVLPNTIKSMTEKEHAFAWQNETKTDTYVLHGYPRTRARRLYARISQLKRKVLP